MTKTFTVELSIRIDMEDGYRYEKKDMFFDVGANTYKEAADHVFNMEKDLYKKGLHFCLSVNNNGKTNISGKCFYYDN